MNVSSIFVIKDPPHLLMDSYKRKNNGLSVPVCMVHAICNYWQFLNSSKVIGLRLTAVLKISVIAAPRQRYYHLSQLPFHDNSSVILSVKFKRKVRHKLPAHYQEKLFLISLDEF